MSKQSFEIVRLFGQPVLYSLSRVSSRNLPKAVHRYELTRASGDDLFDAYLEPHAHQGYCCTIISKFPLPSDHLRTDRDLELDTEELVTVQDYLEDSYAPEPEPEDEITVLVVEPWQLPYEARISNNYQAMQEIVGGPIEIVSPFDDSAVLVCCEIGKLLGLPLNREIQGDIIAGTFFICGIDPHRSDFISLSSRQIERYRQLFRSIEIFIPRSRH